MKYYKVDAIQSIFSISVDEVTQLIEGGYIERVILPSGAVRYSLDGIMRHITPKATKCSLDDKLVRAIKVLKKAGGAMPLTKLKSAVGGAYRSCHVVVDELIREGAICVYQPEPPLRGRRPGRPTTLVTLVDSKAEGLLGALESPSSEVSP